MSHRLWVSALAALSLALAGPQIADLPTPEAHFGFRMGADRRLASADAIERYFEIVAAGSDRVELTDVGPTTEGRRTIAAVISAPENIRNLAAIRQSNARLADPRSLSPDEARRLTATQKAVLVVGGGIHSREIGATQAANEWLHSLATSSDPRTLRALENVVIILIPSLNPDGHRLVADWYQRTAGTPYEGGPMPWLYHKYAGHDINRDAFMMNLAENRNLARLFYTEWHPHVLLSMHEMASPGPRFLVPPSGDPIDRNYDPLIWRESALLGSAMALQLERDGRSGVSANATFDYYWPGYEDSAPLGHNTVCLLTEAAQVNVASPVSVAPSDVRPTVGLPNPWPGGPWTLRDIVDYELSAVEGLLHAVASYREEIVQGFYDMGRRAVEAGRRGGPFAFMIPPEQHDPHATAKLEELLLRGQIEIHRTLEPFRADGEPYPAGTDVILLAQPYRAYVKTLLERQNYPSERQAGSGRPERPYDVAGWTLPAQMGVDVITIERSFEPPAMSRVTTAAIAQGTVWGDPRPSHYVIDARGNGGAIAVNRLLSAGVAASWATAPVDAGGFRYDVGSIVVPYTRQAEPVVAGIAKGLGLRADGLRGRLPGGLRPIGRGRVALYKSWIENADEGWTRWLLEQYEFPFASIADADVRAGNLAAKYDTIVLPSAPPDQLMSGHAGGLPPEYLGGLGPDGAAALDAFVRGGGTLVALDKAGRFAIDVFGLPVRDVAEEAGDKLWCPGSILRMDVDVSQPLAYGMPARSVAFFTSSSAYEPSFEGSGLQTIARYAGSDLLLSGWLEGGDVIAGRSAVVSAAVGLGRVVLIGFRAQHRGQSHATFRLLFNSLFTAR